MKIFDANMVASIVVPKGGNTYDGYAEKQLKKYLDRITGGNFPILPETECMAGNVIYVGETEKTKQVLKEKIQLLEEDGYVIYCDETGLYLTGKNTLYSSAGTVYAVFEFLEKFLGVHFYSYDEEIVPTLDEIDVPMIDLLENPKITTRQYLAASTRRHQDYCVKMRIKDCYCGDVPGGTIHPLWADGQGHNYYEYCKPELYKEKHPEWFDMENHQLCFSCPESAKITIEGLKKKILEKPDSKLFAFGQNDTPTPCQCEKCKASYKKYGVSGTMIRYTNIIAKEIKKWAKETCPQREIYIVIMAYLFSVEPPVIKTEGGYKPIDESVVPCDNIYVFYCNIDYCFYHSLLDQTCEWNKKFLDGFYGWKSLVGNKMFVWNYCANYPHYLYPFYGYNVVAENYRFFADNGVKHVLEHGSCEAEFVDFSELKTYVYSKLLWNPQLDCESLMSEFIDAYYKQCAPEIKKYFALLKERFAQIDKERRYHLRVYHLPEAMFAVENFSFDFIYKLFDCFESALVKVETIADAEQYEILKKRIVRGYISAKYLLLMNYDKYGLSEESKEIFIEKFVEDCRYCGIVKYKEDWRPNVDTIPNLAEEARKGEVLKY